MGDSPHQVTHHEAGTTSGAGAQLQKLETRIADTVQAAESVAAESATAIKERVQTATGAAREVGRGSRRAAVSTNDGASPGALQ